MTQLCEYPKNIQKPCRLWFGTVFIFPYVGNDNSNHPKRGWNQQPAWMVDEWLIGCLIGCLCFHGWEPLWEPRNWSVKAISRRHWRGARSSWRWLTSGHLLRLSLPLQPPLGMTWRTFLGFKLTCSDPAIGMKRELFYFKEILLDLAAAQISLPVDWIPRDILKHL